MSIETKEGLFALMEQIAEEREAARPIVEKLIASGEPLEDIEIPEGWRTAGFAIELTNEAESIDESDARRSLSLQHLAYAIAAGPQIGTYSAPTQAYLLGTIWNNIGWQHFYANAYNAAVAACDSAGRIFSQESVLARENARAQLRKAQAFTCIRKTSEALKLIESAVEVFKEFGDSQRVAIAKVVRADLFQFLGDHHLARSGYEQLLLEADSSDLRTLASIHNNLGHTLCELGRLEDAVIVLQRARALDVELGLPTVKPDWGLARVLLRSGEYEKAIAILQRIRNEFVVRRMHHDVGLVGLDIVDALIALNRFVEARNATEEVLSEFETINLHDDAATALAYLRDLMPQGENLRRAVRHVRSYVERLQFEPTGLFLPLDDSN